MKYFSATRGSGRWRRTSTVSYCAVIAILFTASMEIARGETDRVELLRQKPLAQCAVQQLKSPDAKPQTTTNACGSVQSVTEINSLEYYARSHDGQWSIPAQVDRSDPWIRVLVMGPTMPILVDLAIHVEGVPFRDWRESWIDSLVEQATASTSVDPVEEVEPAESSTAVVSETATEDPTDEDAVPVVKVRSRRPPTASARLRQYLAAGVADTDRDEIRWLLAEWAGGPGLLTLAPAMSWRRAKLAPLWSWLDTDHDQVLSTEEISKAPAQLRQADVDEDDVIDLAELHPEESDSPYPRAMSHPLAVVLNEQTDWNGLRREMVARYDAQAGARSETDQLKTRLSLGDRSLTVADIQGLLYESPDFACSIDLTIGSGEVVLLAVDGDQVVSSSENVITIDCDGTYVELSAITCMASKSEKNQIAIGAVVDGYPLFRLLDQDNNHRLTSRECRHLGKSLAGLDRNADGKIAGAELPTAIRLTVTRGLLAHEALDQPIAASRELRDLERPTAPSWFADMDRNADGDLSQREFLGTSEQFSRLDRDGDGLVNTLEVQDFPVSNE